jgi:hypothetical protein
MQAWNGWLHCSGSTYGSWLRGDPRGWRSFLHREHCEGDYKAPPPPGQFEWMHEQSKRLMARPGVTLSSAARKVACDKMVEALRFHQVEALALCVGGRHWHVLARFPSRTQSKSRGIAIPRLWRNRDARHYMGIAKKESARALSKLQLASAGGVWAKGCGVKPVKDRRHQLRVFGYILEHAKQGAEVWSFRDAEPS